ncbi:arylsulfatase [Novosphingobium sp. PhB165]|uniref:arylsulfatase n=1 Tax=Novosphingobium sp. PhB165 TaxID=2485105 RepID=UPI0010464175|nr:arylsulfatase [Novosphingobium sp. PhB165]TCM14182.1 arylsulfatase [Novosphingobium sp. PhB165]
MERRTPLLRPIRHLLAATSLSLAVLSLAPAAASAPAAVTERPAQAQPNILMIVLDDVGFSDLGAYGGEIRTPNIDALAADGLRYNRFDTKAICSPTRAALLTGRNPQTVRMEDLAADKTTPDPTQSAAARGELPVNAETVAQALHAAGYATYAFGKWHLSTAFDTQTGHNKESWPLQRGFDHYYGYLGGWTDQYQPDLVEDNQRLPKPTRTGYILAEDLADHAVAAFAQDQSDQPKFVYLAFTAGHTPIQVPKRYIDAYGDTYAKGWDAIRAERFARLKAKGLIPADTVLPPINPGDRPWASLSPDEKRVFARFMAAYAGYITHADEQIGRVIAQLKASGQYDNTLIVLLSDNGGAPEGDQMGGFYYPYHYSQYPIQDHATLADMVRDLDKLGGPDTKPLYQRPWAMVSSTPFRRYKLWPYAGGSRDPLIVSWPGHITGKGAIRGQYVDAIDIAPTLLEAAGTHFHDAIGGQRQIPVAGRSILPTFASATAPTRQVQFFELRGNRAIRSGNWKAVAIHRYGTDFSADKWELFNTATDFSESRDLSRRYPAKLKKLQALWWSEARKYSDPPLAEPKQDIRGMHQYDDDFPAPSPTTDR